MRFLLIALAYALTSPAQSQTLGITGAEFRLGAVATADSAPDLTLGFSAVNVAITQHHGLQLDAGLEDTPAGIVGRICTHLFMTPRPAQKYGLYATLADLDGEDRTWGSFGVEGILAATPATTAELRGGIGYGSEGLDWITASAMLAHQAGTATLRAGAAFTEFDEPGMQTIATEITLGVETRLTRRIGGFAEVAYVNLDDDARTYLRTGLSLTFGDLGGVSPLTQLFRGTDPVAALLRFGLY